MNPANIPTAELFADYQQSCTDIMLMELINSIDYSKRLEEEKKTNARIVEIIRSRFADIEISNFLENGYPRRINLK